MVRLIDANALMDKLPDEWNKYPDRDVKDTTGITIAGMPTIDPAKHGHWESIGEDILGYTDMFECSECEQITHTPSPTTELDYEYCPHCGAKMDEVAE